MKASAACKRSLKNNKLYSSSIFESRSTFKPVFESLRFRMKTYTCGRGLGISAFTLADSALWLDLDWTWIASPPVWTQTDWIWTEFGLYSNSPNRGAFTELRKDSDSIRSNGNAIRLSLDRRWVGCYGEIAVCFSVMKVQNGWTLTSHFTKSRARQV